MVHARWMVFVFCACLPAGNGIAREPLWQQTYPFAPSTSFVSGAAFAGSGEIVLGGDGGLVGVAVRSGVTAWTRPGANPRIAVGPDGTVFTAEIRDGAVSVARLAAGGKTAWEVIIRDTGLPPESSLDSIGGAAADGRSVFVLVNIAVDARDGGTTPALACLAFAADTGRPRWTIPLLIPGASSHAGTSVIAPGDGRVFAAGRAYVFGQSFDTTVFCIAGDDGTVLWHDSLNGFDGADEIVPGGLASAPDGGLYALAASTGIDGSVETLIERLGSGGARLWTTRFRSPDGPTVPAAIGRAENGRVYVAGTSGVASSDKRLFAIACDGGNGRIAWSSAWRPGGGSSGASALAIGPHSLFVAGWAGSCGFLTCMAPAVLSFDLATGALRESYVGESPPAGGRFSAAAFHRDGLLAAAGVRYGTDVFTGSIEAMLFADLDQECFIRSDANSDGRVSLADAVAVLAYLFGGKELACLDAADINDDGRVNLSDPIRLLLYLFATGSQPPPPFPSCGPDGRHDLLPCAAAPACTSAGCP